jgi:hypothetical protein
VFALRISGGPPVGAFDVPSGTFRGPGRPTLSTLDVPAGPFLRTSGLSRGLLMRASLITSGSFRR